jgi:hypothetical protein
MPISLAMKMRRSCVAMLGSGAACLLLGACGAGQARTTGGAAGAAGGAVHDVVSTLGAHDGATPVPSRPQALAFAQAVNLNVGEIPEASVESKPSTRSTATEQEEYRACDRSVGWSDAHMVAQASSPKLKRGQELEIELIRSSVAVVSSERTTDRQFALLASPVLRKCAARVLTRNLDDKPIRDARWGRVTVTRLPVRAPGAAATVGIRVVAMLNIPFNEVSIPIYVDELGFAIGRAEVGLLAASATQPVPASTEQELVALLLARAKAHPL